MKIFKISMKAVFPITLLFFSYGILFLSYGCNPYEKWEIAVKTDKEGNVVLGSKQALIGAIRNGSEVRIGWGSKGKTRSIEHLSQPIWLAIINENEVLAHLDPQHLSVIDWNTLEATYSTPDRLRNEWRVVLNTNGVFDAVVYDRKIDTVIENLPQRHPMTWFVQTDLANANQPFYEVNGAKK